MSDSKISRSEYLRVLITNLKNRFKEKDGQIEKLENQVAALRSRVKELEEELRVANKSES